MCPDRGRETAGDTSIAIVWYGIRAMQRADDRRAREQDQRHNESMTALWALIARSDTQIRALEVLIARTGPAADQPTESTP